MIDKHTITICNLYYGIDNEELYNLTTIKGLLTSTKVANVVNESIANNPSANLLIKYQNGYICEEDYNKLTLQEKQKHWTIKKDDYIIKGSYVGDVVSCKTKQKVISYIDYDYGLRHLEITTS